MEQVLPSKHPMAVLRQEKVDKEEWIEQHTAFLVGKANEEPNCVRRSSSMKTTLKCSCLSVFLNDTVAKSTATFCYYYGSKDRVTRLTRLADWIRYTETKKRSSTPFLLPSVLPDPKPSAEVLAILQSTQICQSSLMLILGIGKRAWSTARTSAETGLVPAHGLKGRVGAASNKSTEVDSLVREDVIEYLEDLSLSYGEPRATVVVRTLTGVSLRNSDNEIIELPPFLSKRKIYARFCYSRGFVAVNGPRGKITVEKRTDEMCDVDLELPVGSFTLFNQVWKEEFPTLLIRAPVEDICGDCYRFSQLHKARQGSVVRNPFCLPCPYEDVETDNEDLCDEEADDISIESANASSKEDEDEEEKQLKRREKEYAKIGRHVLEAANMRQLAKEARAQSVSDTKANKPMDNRTITIVADFSQNMELPLFGGQQPGETYYYNGSAPSSLLG